MYTHTHTYICMHVQSLQLCLTLCDPVDCSQPGFSVHGIIHARILEWVAMTSSKGSTQPGSLPNLYVYKELRAVPSTL